MFSFRFNRSFFAVITVVSLLFAASSASAQEKTFQELVTEAKTAYDAEEFLKAVDLLIAANQVEPNARLLLNIARSYEKGGKCAEALAYYGAFGRHSSAEESLVDVANAEAEAIDCEEFDARTAGRVVFTSTPKGAKVAMNGKELGTTPFEVVMLEPGIHTFTFTLDGHDTAEKKLQLTAESDLNIEQSLAETKAVVQEEPVEPVEKPAEPAEKDMTQYYIAGGVTAVGVGFLGLGLIYDLAVIPGTDDERAEFEPGSPEWDELTDRRDGESTIALMGYIVGSALTVGGVAWLTYLFLTDTGAEADDKDSTIQDRIGIAPIIGEDTTGLTVFGRF